MVSSVEKPLWARINGIEGAMLSLYRVVVLFSVHFMFIAIIPPIANFTAERKKDDDTRV